MAAKPLTITEVKGLKPRAKRYEVFDGRGLLLCVSPAGGKSWRFRYSHPITKIRQTYTIGRFPEFTLAEARERRDELRRMVARGVDPVTEHREEKNAARKKHLQTFGGVVAAWFDIKKESGLRPNTMKTINMLLNKHLIPIFGEKPIHDMSASFAIGELEKISNKPAMLKRTISLLNEVMNYAINCGVINVNPLAKIKAAFPTRQSKAFAALPVSDLHDFIAWWDTINSPTMRYALIFQMLTMTRPTEAREASWAEIDFDARLWTIPAIRMKAKREHIVPLSNQALSVLEEMKKIRRGELVFYSIQNSNNSVSSIRITGLINEGPFAGRVTQHGFRSMWSTLLNEEGFNPDVIEAALAHKGGDAIRAIYNRTTYMEQRKVMMQWVGDFFDDARKGIIRRSGAQKGLRVVNE
ncbi:integrase arm-type DNA-binding domain-containing protein [Lelliottia amnigena]|uniref:tyrosine-type recombinase/integrase n=1 Tax=Lelliottia amnigena TaxID=61646 RepID=UPI00192AA3D6|nr:integrase arm-type DNA-binding domain-containing protein [Lelliottia amnigena]MBL5920621.1 integrase arm-type DNA-binding domain-containing protein [Lelliottia amnigena]